jgi:hypothetical protein
LTPSSLVTDVATVGPEDVDSPGELAPKVVKSQEAHELIKRVRANYPVDLVVVESREEDRPRTAALDADEVLEAATEEFGDDSEPGGVVKVLSARVRGKDQPLAEKAVCVLWETPSGRTARGAFGYAPLSTSIEDFDSKIASGEITEVDEGDAKDLKRTVERQEDQIRRLNQQLASQSGSHDSESADVEIPTGKANELIKRIRAGDFSAEDLTALLEVEQGEKTPRNSVIDAAEKALEQLSQE